MHYLGKGNFINNISNKPCQCRNIDYWTDDTYSLGQIVYQQRYRHNDSTNADTEFRMYTQSNNKGNPNNERSMRTRNKTYSLSFVTHIFHNG